MDLRSIVAVRWSKRRTINKVLTKLAKINIKDADQLRRALYPPNVDTCALNQKLRASGARPFGQSTIDELLRLTENKPPPSLDSLSYKNFPNAPEHMQVKTSRPKDICSAIRSFNQKLRSTTTTVTRRDGTRFVENKDGIAHELGSTNACHTCKQWIPLCTVISLAVSHGCMLCDNRSSVCRSVWDWRRQ